VAINGTGLGERIDVVDQRSDDGAVLGAAILTAVVAGGLVVSAYATLVAVFNSDVTRVLIDKAYASLMILRRYCA
jgi:hypothetical protein